MDALLSTVQMPTGIPVATVAVDSAANAGYLAVALLAMTDEALAGKAGRIPRGPPRMIPRYSLPEMSAIWSEQRKLAAWKEVETLVLEAWGRPRGRAGGCGSSGTSRSGGRPAALEGARERHQS